MGVRFALGPVILWMRGWPLVTVAHPHFLNGAPWWVYLYASPTGLPPCPTIAMAVGFSLVLGARGSPAWSGILGVVGMLYGAFGAAWLGVTLDWVPLTGSFLLLVQMFLGKRSFSIV